MLIISSEKEGNFAPYFLVQYIEDINIRTLATLVSKADNYIIAHQWIANTLPTVVYCVHQKWCNRFNSENHHFFGKLAARFCTDENLKKLYIPNLALPYVPLQDQRA